MGIQLNSWTQMKHMLVGCILKRISITVLSLMLKRFKADKNLRQTIISLDNFERASSHSYRILDRFVVTISLFYPYLLRYLCLILYHPPPSPLVYLPTLRTQGRVSVDFALNLWNPQNNSTCKFWSPSHLVAARGESRMWRIICLMS